MEVDRTVGDADGTSESKAAPRSSANGRKKAASAVKTDKSSSARKTAQAEATPVADSSDKDEGFKRARARNAGKLEKSLDATQLYLNEIGFSPLLSADEEKYYARLALSGDDAGRRRMIESNLRLVVKISRRYINRGLTLLDLIEEGNLGLIRAVENLTRKGVFASRHTPPGGSARRLSGPS